MLNFNNKGFILVTAYMVIAVLIILGTGLAVRSISEERVAFKERDVIQALWLAEAGLDRAISQLPNTPLSGNIGIGTYLTQTTPLSATKFLIDSKGGVPGIDEPNPNNAICKIKAIVEKPLNPASAGGITAVISANGDVVIQGGAAQVTGDVDDNAVFDFEDIFGVSKDTMKSNADHIYVDPSNNITPVDQITWIDLNSLTEVGITSSGWLGSGILIVNGDMKITGGHFDGVIWVIGTLRVSGNPVIDGSIFVESGAEFDTTITGNPTVSYDSSAISNAFNFLPSDLPPRVISWKQD